MQSAGTVRRNRFAPVVKICKTVRYERVITLSTLDGYHSTTYVQYSHRAQPRPMLVLGVAISTSSNSCNLQNYVISEARSLNAQKSVAVDLVVCHQPEPSIHIIFFFCFPWISRVCPNDRNRERGLGPVPCRMPACPRFKFPEPVIRTRFFTEETCRYTPINETRVA